MSDKTRWDDLDAFRAVARFGGLSAAARETGASAPTLGRRMHALERQLGRELFRRRSHGYDLTAEGRALLRAVDAAAATIERAVARNAEGVVPTVRVSAGTWTSLALARRITSLAGDPPDLRLSFVSSEAVLSLNRREAAIGIRNRQPTEAGLAGRRLRRVEFAAYATADASDGWIAVAGDAPSARWLRGRDVTVLHEASHPRLALDLALAGAGRVVLPTFAGDAEAGLEQVGDPIPELAHDSWLVAHDEDRHRPPVRRALDRIAAILAGQGAG